MSIVELLQENSTDPRARLELAPTLLSALARGLPPDTTVLNQFCDMMTAWLGSSNYKVAVAALDILDMALSVSGAHLAPFLVEHLPMLMEKLGDSKEPVRAQTHRLLLRLMRYQPPQHCFDRCLGGGLTHRQWLVRVGVCKLIGDTLRYYGALALNTHKLLPTVCKLVSATFLQCHLTELCAQLLHFFYS